MTAVSIRRPGLQRRSAFTLLEVLVVVAILVVLASVAGIAVFKFLDEAKVDKATLDMQALEKAYKSYVLKSGGEVDSTNFQMGMLVPYLEQGSNALIDPWQNQYQCQPVQGESGEERMVFFTINMKTGERISWPRR